MRTRSMLQVARSLLAAALLAVTGTVAAVTVTAAPAYADCAPGAETNYLYNSYFGAYVGKESPQYASTCDGDRVYKGKVFDIYTDGSCAYSRWLNLANQVTTQGYSCDAAGNNFTYYGDGDAAWDAIVTEGSHPAATGWIYTWGF